MQFFQDVHLIFTRQLQRHLRNPVWVVLGVTQPLLYLAFFGPLLLKVFPSANAWQIYVPGLLVQQGLFGTSFVGFGIIGDWREGIIERMRVTPVSRLALLLGRVLVDVCALVLHAGFLVIAAWFFGLQAPVAGVVISLAFMALLGLSLASLSYATGLIVKSEDSFAPLLSTVTLPLLLLSGMLLPMALAPNWLRKLSLFNPLLYVVEAMRKLFLGDYFSGQVGAGLVAILALAAVSLAFGARVFRKENV
jgi:ABC-2 type transport system permease protein